MDTRPVIQNAVLVRQGSKYLAYHAAALRDSIEEHSGMDVVILGDGEDADVPLEHGHEGWWAKMELFRPDLAHLRPFFFLDLDSLVLRPFELHEPERFTICREWINRKPDDPRCQSSAMLIPEDTTEIWEKWQEDKGWAVGDKRGDQWFLQQFEHDWMQDIYPDLVGSYKVHSVDRPKHRIVTFHGDPKPWDAPGWAAEEWRRASKLD